MGDERERLRRTFDLAASDYQAARPDYPDSLFDELVSVAGVGTGDRLLEVGCASGKATLPLARRGLAITCVELGAALAAEARRNLGGFPQVEVICSDLESWTPDGEFALAYAATAWKWLDPAVKYRKVWELLRPGGHLAFWDATHVFPAGGDTFFREIQPVYDEIGRGDPFALWPPPAEMPDSVAEVDGSGLFEVVHVRRFDWEIAYTADDYLRLLNTFSSHIELTDGQRDRLYGEIRRRLAGRPDGLVRRHWGAVLHVARRR